MALSSSSLFHFTKGGLTALEGIISGGFWVTYCNEIPPNEYFDNNTSSFEPVLTTAIPFDRIHTTSTKIKVPMVCFCDIPLSNVNHHTAKYGKHAIGLTKDWGIKNGLNPVSYIARNSLLAKEIAGFSHRKTSKPPTIDEDIIYVAPYTDKFTFYDYDPEGHEIVDSYGFIYSVHMLYTKPVGCYELVNNQFQRSNFQDEREWRYLPPKPCILRCLYRNTHSNHLNYWATVDYCQRNANEAKPQYPNLGFDPFEDITFIIVEKESEVPEIVKFLVDSFSAIDDKSKLFSLISKVTSYERMEKDIFV